MLKLLPHALRWRVYSRLVADPCAPGPDVVVRRRVHGSKMLLHRSDWMENFAAISGGFYDGSTIAVLRRVLDRGWAYMDVGANVGFTVLAAARLVGRSGFVTAFEPNPVAFERLSANLGLNGLENVRALPFALGASDHVSALHQGEHHGTSSMRSGGDVPVEVRCGDDFAPAAGVPLLVKIDVEGYEVEVLKGMKQLLARPNTTFFIEVTDNFLREAGSSATELLAMFSGYDARAVSISPLSKLHFEAVDPIRGQQDVLFTRR